MKLGFNKLFKKKKQNAVPEESVPKEQYTSMNSNSLYSLPVPELVTIIFKYDQELKSLNQDLTTSKDQHQSLKQTLQKLQDESTLYKETKDNAQFECHRLATELNEAVTSLDSCQAQLDLLQTQLASRDSLLQTLKSQVSELEKRNCELQLTGMQLSSTEEIEKLKSKMTEYTKQEQTIRELAMKNETLEKEVKKLTVVVGEGKEQIRVWKEKTNLFENARNEAEAELGKRKNELEEFKVEIKRLMFLKESVETENRGLKESINQKDVSIQKKVQKIEKIESSNLDLQQKVTVLKYESEMYKNKLEADLKAFQEQSKHEKDLIELEWKTKEEQLFKENEKLQSNSRLFEEINLRLEAIESEKARLAQQLTIILTEVHEKQRKIDELIATNSKLSNSLQVSNKKRELAKSEIFKLSQKMEALQKLTQNNYESKQVVRPATVEEINALTWFKTELDSLYKTLIGLISDVEKELYKVKIVDFTNFEKKMNNLVMSLHEEIEEQNHRKFTNVTIPQTASKGRLPIKLFSCMVDQDETQPRVIPKPKRPPQPIDSQLVLRRGSAN